MKRVLVLSLCLLMVFTLIPLKTTEAATKITSSDGRIFIEWKLNSGGYYTGKETATFYVKTPSSLATPTITIYSQNKGTLRSATPAEEKAIGFGSAYGKNLHGYYDIRTYYKNGSNWTEEKHLYMKGAESKEVTFNKKNTVYKVAIYFWSAETTFKNHVQEISSRINGTRCWTKTPQLKIQDKRAVVINRCKLSKTDSF